MKDYRLYWIWLAEQAGQGSKLAVKLINIFGSADKVYGAEDKDLDALVGIGLTKDECTRCKKILADKSLKNASRILKDAEDHAMRVLVPTDRDYPINLKNLRDAPMVLYVLGRLPDFNKDLCISVVSSREMTPAGRRNCYSMGYGLAAAGAVVVSGMALGGDSVALSGAAVAGGRLIAVLGCGADVIYPKKHENLYRTILSKGAVISEYPPGAQPLSYHFPVRNRIISGLSSATVVIEGGERSGTLITACHAVAQGRTVYAVPGDVAEPQSAGPNILIKNGANLVTSAVDVIEDYEYVFPKNISGKMCCEALERIDPENDSKGAMLEMKIVSKTKENLEKNNEGRKKSAVPWEDCIKEDKKSGKKSSGDSVKLGDEAPVSGDGKVPPPHLDLDFLDDKSIDIYNRMTPDKPVNPEEIAKNGEPVEEIMCAMTLLELAGAVEACEGGYFIRISDEKIELTNE